MGDQNVEVQPATKLALVAQHPSSRETVPELFARVLARSGEKAESMIVVWLDAEDHSHLQYAQIGTNGSALWLLAQAQLSVLRG